MAKEVSVFKEDKEGKSKAVISAVSGEFEINEKGEAQLNVTDYKTIQGTKVKDKKREIDDKEQVKGE